MQTSDEQRKMLLQYRFYRDKRPPRCLSVSTARSVKTQSLQVSRGFQPTCNTDFFFFFRSVSLPSWHVCFGSSPPHPPGGEKGGGRTFARRIWQELWECVREGGVGGGKGRFWWNWSCISVPAGLVPEGLNYRQQLSSTNEEKKTADGERISQGTVAATHTHTHTHAQQKRAHPRSKCNLKYHFCQGKMITAPLIFTADYR